MANERGVSVRESSIRLIFTTDQGLQRKTLTIDGKPMLPTPRNILYANKLIVEIRALIRARAFRMEEYFPAGGTVARGGTLAQHLAYWLELQTIEASTKAGYLSAIKFWNGDEKSAGRLGEKSMQTLRHSDILKALKRKRLHGKTQKNYIDVLHNALALAVKDKLIKENPCDDVHHAPWQKDPPDPFDLEEAEKIIAHMAANFHPFVCNMVEWRFFTGVRTSEMVGLQRPSIDWNKRQVAVSEAVVRGKRKATKTNTVRLIDLNTRALAALQRQSALLDAPGAAVGNVVALPGAAVPPGPEYDEEHDSVWIDPRYGTPWIEERAFRRSFWTPTLKKLGIRYRPPNNMRHSYATMLLMAGAKPAYAAKQMGHSVELFLKTYSRWIDGGENDREQAKLESFIVAQTAPALPQPKRSGTAE